MLRSFKVSSPVLMTVAVTLKLLTPSTASGPETLRVSPGVAETAMAEATRATKAERTDVENMVELLGGDWRDGEDVETERPIEGRGIDDHLIYPKHISE